MSGNCMISKYMYNTIHFTALWSTCGWSFDRREYQTFILVTPIDDRAAHRCQLQVGEHGGQTRNPNLRAPTVVV